MRRAPVGGSETLYYMFSDHLGGTSVVLNTSNGVTNTVNYYPYGARRQSTGDLQTDRLFTGQRLDGTGLYDYGARQYDPYLNRWISPDTIVPQPGNPQDLSRYSYVRNNPIRYRDGGGHFPIDIVLDLVSVLYDAYTLVTQPSWENGRALGVDVGLTFVPYVPAPGIARLGLKALGGAERFSGAGESVLKGVQRLETAINNDNIPYAYRKGLEAQFNRAEEYFKQGKLKSVEFTEGKNRCDLVLEADKVVEVKLWRQSYTEQHRADVAAQLKKYQGSGRDVVVEFVQTKSDPISEGYLDELWEYLQAQGVDIARDNLRLVE